MYYNLRKARKSSGITIRYIANMLNIKTATGYLKKETGASKTTVDEAILLARLFNMPVEVLFAKK